MSHILPQPLLETLLVAKNIKHIALGLNPDGLVFMHY